MRIVGLDALDFLVGAEGVFDLAVLDEQVAEGVEGFDVAGKFRGDFLQERDGAAARGGLGVRIEGRPQALELEADEFLAEGGGRFGAGEAGLQGRFAGGIVAGARLGGGQLQPAQRPFRETAGHLAEEFDDAFAVADVAVDGGQPEQRAFGIRPALEEILDRAQGLGGPALEDEGGGQAQHEPFVAGVEFRGPAVGIVGRGVVVGEFVVDAEGVQRERLRGARAFGRQEGGGRNDPSVQQGRRGGQRAAAGRDAEEDEAERKASVIEAAHGVPANGQRCLTSSCDGPRADVCGVCAWPSSNGVSF